MCAHAAEHQPGLTPDQIRLLNLCQRKRLIAMIRVTLELRQRCLFRTLERGGEPGQRRGAEQGRQRGLIACLMQLTDQAGGH